ncbi:protein-L-isoaspartate(D-aspartate) O-methyltransferase [Natrinema limicola]|uniref:Protein-L-isoaspartate O-methyltransferase n=1 Tax=Natrinema limicola JCM 13563 TaxID=1230457 RepID=M0C6I0_9EURY|nr:protein-L-isoaspartate(D-aspartate) O-methyltransferase [Natrinema limicola]ELZ17504.1 protein-L-isoaspartate carboxylmethyltransferase [Natrinema limicola JCM 13563]
MEAEQQSAEQLVEKLRTERNVYSSKVAAALRSVPREKFVPRSARDRAYNDVPLDIGEGQTISAPHVVADITKLLELREGQRVLEIGTGSGYHAAVTAEIVGAKNVFTIERLPTLARMARRNLAQAGYDEVTVIVGNGSCGLPDRSLFDRIYLTCAAPDIPDPLLEQLADGGRMVVPVPIDDEIQRLTLVEKRDGRVEHVPDGAVQFVPLVGEHGFEA